MADTKVYLSGERIQGRSDDALVASTTFTETFAANTGWTTNNASYQTWSASDDGRLTTTNSSHAYKAFAIGEPTTMVMDWDWKITNSTPDSPFIILSSSTAGYGDPPSGHKRIILMINASGSGGLRISGRFNDGSLSEDNNANNTWLGTYNVKQYYRFKVSGGNFYLSIYGSAADREAESSAIQTTSITSYNAKYTSGTADFAYLDVGSYGAGGTNIIYNWDFWTGITNPATDKSKDSITDVPAGTRYEEVDTKKIFYRAGSPYVVEWVEKGTVPSTPPQVYMVMAGSMSGAFNQIDRLTIATLGNASAFGTLNIGRAKCTGVSNEVLGLICGGDNNANGDIESITIASGSQSADYGDLVSTRQRAGGCSAEPIDRGLIGGGQSSGNTDIIDYLTIGTGGTAGDFGDLTTARQWVSGAWSDTRGVFIAGTSSNVMDYVTMATLGNATDFGDNTMSRYSASSLTNKTRGVTCGGYQSSQTDTMDYITIDTPSNATDFGNLESSAEECYCGGDLVNRGIIANADHLSTEIQYISIDTAGNSVDFGDLDTAVHDGCTVNGT